MEILILKYLVIFFYINCSIATIRPKRDLNLAVKHTTYKEINVIKCLATQINNVENLRYEFRIILMVNYFII